MIPIPDPDTFAREQEIQRAIGIVQKTTRASILQIDELTIRAWINRGWPSSRVAQQWMALVKQDGES
jgi:hypothetical protein